MEWDWFVYSSSCVIYVKARLCVILLYDRPCVTDKLSIFIIFSFIKRLTLKHSSTPLNFDLKKKELIAVEYPCYKALKVFFLSVINLFCRKRFFPPQASLACIIFHARWFYLWAHRLFQINNISLQCYPNVVAFYTTQQPGKADLRC